MSLRILGVDPSFRNLGMALVDVDLTTMELDVVEIALVTTEKSKNKQIRAASDHLSRGRQLHVACREWEKKAALMAAEIPSGAQSAAAAFGFGVAVGMLSGHTVPLIEVSPIERMMAVVDEVEEAEGKKVRSDRRASKAQVIEWAQTRWPNLPWIKSKSRDNNPNEHMADAIATVLAATKTPNFKQITAVMRSSL